MYIIAFAPIEIAVFAIRCKTTVNCMHKHFLKRIKLRNVTHVFVIRVSIPGVGSSTTSLLLDHYGWWESIQREAVRFTGNT